MVLKCLWLEGREVWEGLGKKQSCNYCSGCWLSGSGSHPFQTPLIDALCLKICIIYYPEKIQTLTFKLFPSYIRECSNNSYLLTVMLGFNRHYLICEVLYASSFGSFTSHSLNPTPQTKVTMFFYEPGELSSCLNLSFVIPPLGFQLNAASSHNDFWPFHFFLLRPSSSLFLSFGTCTLLPLSQVWISPICLNFTGRNQFDLCGFSELFNAVLSLQQAPSSSPSKPHIEAK